MLYVPWPFAPRCLLKQCLAEALNCRSGTSACKITHTAQNKYSIYIERILEKRYIRVYIPPVEAKHLHKHFVCVLGKVCYYIPHLHIRRRRRRTVKKQRERESSTRCIYIDTTRCGTVQHICGTHWLVAVGQHPKLISYLKMNIKYRELSLSLSLNRLIADRISWTMFGFLLLILISLSQVDEKKTGQNEHFFF